VQNFEIPAGQRLTLRPGAQHLMIIGLKKPLALDERIPLTLRFERAGEIRVELRVQSADSKKPHH
jgi:copper(I)-binding protein